jgi:FlaA1/EpsC-like NDP-sugar epimerase
MFKWKNLLRIYLDLVLLSGSFILATLIRLEGQVVSNIDKFIWAKQLINVLPMVVLVELVLLMLFGTYKRFWRYTGLNDIMHLARSLSFASLIFLIPRFMGYTPKSFSLIAISYGVIVINFLLSLIFLSAIRMIRSYLVEQRNIRRRLKDISVGQKTTLVIGAGEAGVEVIKAIATHPELGLKVVGVLDDDKRKHKMKVNGVEVYGPIDEVKYWANDLAVDQIIIAIPSLNYQDQKRINRLCTETDADVRIVPGVDQLAGGHVEVEKIRKLSMEDLLGRAEVDLNAEEVLKFLDNKRVLVTGAGGSIGRELCLQLASKCNISSICLLGKGENSIFEAFQDIREAKLKNSQIEIQTKICDIRNYERMNKIFAEFKPDVVFHAAAHKHVYLMEVNPCEAFENNVIGTRNVSKLAGEHNVGAFVLISTDKSVNPTSIMGSTKNLAEKVVLQMSRKYTSTKYTAVRFGNVLGSRGSVITVWEKQLKNGLPITVTHKDAIRFFMTIPEAAQLVIQAAAKAATGEIMLLDMGEPIRIYDLAKQFIRLSGFSEEDIPINIIGLKDGEKLYEELLTASEFVDSKLTEKIYKAKIDFDLADQEFDKVIDEISSLARANDHEHAKEEIKKLVKKLQLQPSN